MYIYYLIRCYAFTYVYELIYNHMTVYTHNTYTTVCTHTNIRCRALESGVAKVVKEVCLHHPAPVGAGRNHSLLIDVLMRIQSEYLWRIVSVQM